MERAAQPGHTSSAVYSPRSAICIRQHLQNPAAASVWGICRPTYKEVEAARWSCSPPLPLPSLALLPACCSLVWLWPPWPCLVFLLQCSWPPTCCHARGCPCCLLLSSCRPPWRPPHHQEPTTASSQGLRPHPHPPPHLLPRKRSLQRQLPRSSLPPLHQSLRPRLRRQPKLHLLLLQSLKPRWAARSEEGSGMVVLCSVTAIVTLASALNPFDAGASCTQERGSFRPGCTQG